MPNNNNFFFHHLLEDASFQQWIMFPEIKNNRCREGFRHTHPDQRKAMDEARNPILRFK